MTADERQTLCKILRTMEPWPCKQAADEIERLAKRLAQSNAEPVAWRWRYKTKGGCSNWTLTDKLPAYYEETPLCEVEPLYATPPRPDASDPRFVISDDYDKAAIAVLDDFEAALGQRDADDPGDATWRNLKKRMDMGTKEAIDALAQSDAGPPLFNASEIDSLKLQRRRANDLAQAELDKRGRGVNPRILAQSNAEPSIGEDTLAAAFDKFMEDREYKQSGNRLFFHAGVEFGLRHARPPHRDVSAGLIEAAEHLEANNTKFGASWSYCVLLCAKELRTRAADRRGK